MLSTILAYITEIAFVSLGLLSIAEYLRYRDPARRDIALMFNSIAFTILLQDISDLINLQSSALSTLGTLVLITQPYLMLRLVAYFQKVAKYIQLGAWGGMIVSGLALLASGENLSPLLSIPIVLYFVVLNGYAMSSFIYGALTTSGVVRRRLRLTAVGSGLFALTLFIVGLNIIIDLEEITTALSRLTAIGAASTFYLGLATPRWLRQAWQRNELHHYFLQSIDHTTPRSKNEIYDIICDLIEEATSAKAVNIALWHDSDTQWSPHRPNTASIFDKSNSLISQRPAEDVVSHPIPGSELTPDEQQSLQLSSTATLYLITLKRHARRWGTLLMIYEQIPLFLEDDLTLGRLFAEWNAIRLENISLIEALNQQTVHLEQQVQQRTARLSQQNNYLNLLQEVTVAVNESTSVDEPLQTAIDLICATLDFPLGHVLASTADSQMRFVSKFIWYAEDSKKYQAFSQITESLSITRMAVVSRVVSEGHPIWLTDISNNSEFFRGDAARKIGLQTGIFIPVLMNKDIVAVLEFFSDKTVARDNELLDVLANIGLQLGRVIERKQAELAIREREARLSALLEAAPAGIVIIDQQGQIMMANPGMVELFGYTESDLIGQQLEMLLPQNLRDQHTTHRGHYFEAPRPRAMGVGLDIIGCRQDGTTFPIAVGLSHIQTSDGKLGIAFVSDITERKQIEQELVVLNQELEQRVEERTAHLSALNKELEAFSYSVSHDLRSPLRAINGFGQALLEDYYDLLDEEGQEYLELIRMESQRMGQLIDDLIDLSRYARAVTHFDTINLSNIAHQIAHDIRQEDPQREVEFVIEEGLEAYGDQNLIEIVLRNLLENAFKYTRPQAQSRIEFGTTHQNGVTTYYVRDNGVGFNMNYVHKLFGPFQRLHGMTEFEGTGIGLATVQRIINRHGGTVSAEGAVNEGATFYFTLGSRLDKEEGTE